VDVLTCSPDDRKAFAQALTTFIPFLAPTSIQIANRLEIYQKEHNFDNGKSSVGTNGAANENAGLGVAALQLEAVIDLPQINTRAGLYIFLNSLVSELSARRSKVLTLIACRTSTDR
jgi:mediator of RNA polymerase II transcription subunit 5